jgi:hypothetical protein
MMPLSRYRVPKIARHAAFGHMNDYDLETQSCGWDRSSLECARLDAGLRTTSAEAHSFVLTHDVRVDMTRHWPISPADLAWLKASRYGKGCWSDPAALKRKWLLRNRITTVLDPGPDK